MAVATRGFVVSWRWRGDSAVAMPQAERIVAAAMQPDMRNVSTASIYQAWQQQQAPHGAIPGELSLVRRERRA